MVDQKKTLKLLLWGIICIQYHSAMKCTFNEDVLLEEVQELRFGQAIKKHIKNEDYRNIVQCNCANKNKVMTSRFTNEHETIILRCD